MPSDHFVSEVVNLFISHSDVISPAATEDRFGSDKVLALLRDGLVDIGFDVESGKKLAGRINRPVFFGVNGKPTLNYQIDAYHQEWKCGLEVEAGRGLLGGALYRDIVQAMVMTGVDHLIIALLNFYQPSKARSQDFDKAYSIVQALYSHDRVALPFKLTLIGYGPTSE